MDKFIIYGGNRLNGEVVINGAKNAAVAIIPATILSDEICRIENVPNINDVSIIAKILTDMGAKVRMLNKSTLEIDPRHVISPIASSELMRNMRASYYLMGALLGRFQRAVVSMPGGCDFGVRPIDQHLKGFSALGAKCKLEAGTVNIEADELVGSNVYMDVVSVGATINIMLAAVKAKGITVIENAAKEPHIVDLANFLNCMGANIMGAGTDIIKIKGMEYLKGVTYSIIPDQIEAGTYMTIAAAVGGNVLVRNIIPKHVESITAKLEEMGVTIIEYDDAIRVIREGDLNKCNVKTMPHPGFPTDMQPQIVALLSIANGTSIVSEGVWDNRFRYVDELVRMGANISVDGKLAIVEGTNRLLGTTVKATDLRAGAAMLVAGLAAKGVTTIENIHYIERGYENVINKLCALGADIKRVQVEDPVMPKAL